MIDIINIFQSSVKIIFQNQNDSSLLLVQRQEQYLDSIVYGSFSVLQTDRQKDGRTDRHVYPH